MDDNIDIPENSESQPTIRKETSKPRRSHLTKKRKYDRLQKAESLILLFLILILCIMVSYYSVSFNQSRRNVNQLASCLDLQKKEIQSVLNEAKNNLGYDVKNLREIIFVLNETLNRTKNDELKKIKKRINSLQPNLDPAIVQAIAKSIVTNSHVCKLPPSLITHLIYKETIPPFNPLSKSTKGAIGLMQIMYDVHKKKIPELAKLKPKELFYIENNIKFGCQILRGYLDTSKTVSQALKKYVGGDVEGYVSGILELMAEYEVQNYQKIN